MLCTVSQVRPASGVARQVGALAQRKRGASDLQQPPKRPNMGPAPTIGGPSARLPAPIRPSLSASIGAPFRLRPFYQTTTGASNQCKISLCLCF